MYNPTLKNMSRFAALLLAATAVFGQTRNASFSSMTSEAGRFRIEMPGRPEFSTNVVDSALGKLSLYSYSANIGSSAYVVMYADYPYAPSNPEAVLEGVGQGQAKGGRIVKEVTLTLNGVYPGRGVVVEKNGLRFVSANYMVGKRLYQLIVGGPTNGEQPEIGRFLDSFKVF